MAAKKIALQRKAEQDPDPRPQPGMRLLVKDDADALLLAQRILSVQAGTMLILNGPQWRTLNEKIMVLTL